MPSTGYASYVSSERAHVTKDLVNTMGNKVTSTNVANELNKRWKSLPAAGQKIWVNKR